MPAAASHHRPVQLALLLVAIPLTLVACSQKVCAGPALESPHIELRTSAWQLAHPHAVLTACVDTLCEQIGQTVATDLFLPAGVPDDAALRLAITATENARQVLQTISTVRLVKSEVGSPACGRFAQWERSVQLTATGELRPTN
jgi:hypothetical protein